MAVVFTAFGSVLANTTDGTSYNGVGASPAIGDVLIELGFASDSTIAGGGAFTMTGGSLVWTRFFDLTFNGGLDTLVLFWARATATLPVTPILSVVGDTATGGAVGGWRVTGAEGAGAPYFRQLKSATGTSTNPAIVMDRAILTGNGVLSVAVNTFNSAGWTAPASWAAVGQGAYATPSHSLGISSRASGETGSTITWTNANNVAWGAVVGELYVAGTGPEPLNYAGSGGYGQVAS